MIVTIGGIKGGTGKSMIATQLAVLRNLDGQKTRLVDADPQRTASHFIAQRQSQEVKQIPFSDFGDKGLTFDKIKLKNRKESVLIDAGGRNNKELRMSLVVSDVFVVPVFPRSFDLWTIEELYRLVQTANKNRENPIKAFAFINRADSQGSYVDVAIDFIEDTGFKCLQTTIGNRIAFANASNLGRCVTEFSRRDSQAVAELQNLEREIYA